MEGIGIQKHHKRDGQLCPRRSVLSVERHSFWGHRNPSPLLVAVKADDNGTCRNRRPQRGRTAVATQKRVERERHSFWGHRNPSPLLVAMKADDNGTSSQP